ncbi:MAG: hypothetical protein ACYCZY_10080 [Lacisediminihabitans sp.]
MSGSTWDLRLEVVNANLFLHPVATSAVCKAVLDFNSSRTILVDSTESKPAVRWMLVDRR